MIPQKYIPKSLSNKDKLIQVKMLNKSRKSYKKGIYYSRKKLASFKSKQSPHIKKAMKIYNIENIKPNKELSKATNCSIVGLENIVSKGRGAYYSSGSRPNQTAESWGLARLASTITGGNAAKLDYHILEKHCDKNSKALKLAKKLKKKNLKQQNKIQLGGKMIDKDIVKFKNNPDSEFQPNISPQEIFEMGSFGGTYWRPIKSRITNKNYKNEHMKFKDFWKNIPEEHLISEKCNPKINKYKVKAGTSLEFWEDKNWISDHDPYGWVQWYCNFYNGRRIPEEDKRQIDRWKKFSGKKGRFRLWLITDITKNNTDFDDEDISPKKRQGLQHWGYILTKKDFDYEVNRRLKK